MRKKLFLKIILIALMGLPFGQAFAYMPNFTTDAKQALVIDLSTNTVLFEKNADSKMYPSSMTKVMSAYVVFDRLKNNQIAMEDKFRVSENAWRKGGSRTFVNLNDEVRVEDLLRGLIIQSGNDATITLAEGIASDENIFVEEMNLQARELGMSATNFNNSTGWPDPNNYSTARDLSILAQAVIKDFPEHYPLWSEKEFTYNKIRQPNRNPLLHRVRGGEGLKTGHTEMGGHGLIGTVNRDGRRILVVINGFETEKARADGTIRLVEWAYREFENVKLAEKGDVATEVSVNGGKLESVQLLYGDEPEFTVPRILAKKLKHEIAVDEILPAPLHKGDLVGYLKISVPDQEEPFVTPLFVAEDVEKAGMFRRLYRKIKNIF